MHLSGYIERDLVRFHLVHVLLLLGIPLPPELIRLLQQDGVARHLVVDLQLFVLSDVELVLLHQVIAALVPQLAAEHAASAVFVQFVLLTARIRLLTRVELPVGHLRHLATLLQILIEGTFHPSFVVAADEVARDQLVLVLQD